MGDTLQTELGDPSEDLLASALTYRANGSCTPAVTTAAPTPEASTPERAFGSVASSELAIRTSPNTQVQDMLQNSRDLTRP